MTTRHKIFNTYVDKLTMRETIDRVSEAIAGKKQLHHIALNAGKVVSMQHDEELTKSVNAADIISADGQSIVWASKWLGIHLPERVSGIDLMENLVAAAPQKGYRIFFLGAKEEIVSKVVEIYREKYTPDIIAGYRNGYFKEEDEPTISQQIADSGANILFVAITSPKKENFLYRNKEALKNVNFIMGVGGSFDVVAGLVQRAPLWMQRMGLEWFYRFIQEPGRMWKRYLVGNFSFIILVIKEKFRAR